MREPADRRMCPSHISTRSLLPCAEVTEYSDKSSCSPNIHGSIQHGSSSITLLSVPFLLLAAADISSQQCAVVDGGSTTEPLFKDDNPHECQNGTFHLGLRPYTYRGPTTGSQWHGTIFKWVEGGEHQRKKKKACEAEKRGLRQIVRQFKTHIQLIIIWSVCVCLIPFLSWSQHSSVQEHFFFFSSFPQIPVDTALCVFTYEAACTCQSVCIPDAWAGIHGDGLGLELICSSTCEMRTRGEGDRQRRVPSHSHQAPIQTGADTLWYDSTHTHTETHILAPPPPHSRFPFAFS